MAHHIAWVKEFSFLRINLNTAKSAIAQSKKQIDISVDVMNPLKAKVEIIVTVKLFLTKFNEKCETYQLASDLHNGNVLQNSYC